MKTHHSETLVMGALVVSFLILLSPGLTPVLGAAYTVTLQTDKSAYSGAQPITISGTVAPPPGPGTAIIILVKNPSGIAVDIEDSPVDGTTGTFSEVTIPGGNANWVAGTYSINGTWGGNGVVISKLVTFNYSPTTATSTTTASTTSSTASSGQMVSTKWNPYTDFYSFVNYGLFHYGGDCYGFSSTAVLYFRHYQLGDQSYPYYPESTGSVAAMPGQTGSPFGFCLLGFCLGKNTLYQSTFPIYIHQTYGQLSDIQLVSDEQTQVQLLMSSIQSGTPVVLGLNLGTTHGHAVVAWEYEQSSNGNLIIGISDPDFGNTPRYAYYTNGQFSYTGTYTWTTFFVLSSQMLQWDWLSPIQLSSTVVSTNSYYAYIFSSAPITIVGQSGRASFGTPGDSLTFSNSIAGVVGFEEGNIQVYGIPIGTQFTILDPGEMSSLIVVIIPQNQISIVGYQITTSSQTPLNMTIAPSSSGVNMTTSHDINSSLVFFSVGRYGRHAVLNTTSLPIGSAQKASFTVANWGQLNSTRSPVTMQVFQPNSTTPISSYTLNNGQQGLPGTVTTTTTQISLNTITATQTTTLTKSGGGSLDLGLVLPMVAVCAVVIVVAGILTIRRKKAAN